MDLKKMNFWLPAFTVWYVSEILQYIMIYNDADMILGPAISVVNVAVMLMLLVQIVFCQKYTLMETAVIGFMTAIILIITAGSASLHLLCTWMFVVAAKHTRLEDGVSRAYRILLIMIPLIVMCGVFGITEDIITYRGSRVRHSLGFNHPNNLGVFMLQFICSYFFGHRKNFRIRHVLFAAAAILFVYLVPNSQTSYCCMIALLISVLLERAAKRLGESFEKAYEYLLVVLSALFNLLSVFWSVTGYFPRALDAFLSVRFSTCHRTYQVYGVRLFGNPSIAESGHPFSIARPERLFLDNGYMSLLLRYGVIAYALFSAVYIATMLYCRRHQRGDLLLFLFTFALYGVMEPGIYLFGLNVFLLTFSDLLYGKEENRNRTVSENICLPGVRR